MKTIQTLFFFLFFFSSLAAQNIHTENIYFKSDKHLLDATNTTSLISFLSDLSTYNESNIRIIGHTDQDGSNEYNIELSKKRAEAVKQYFLNNGIPESSIEVRFLGESDLVSQSLDNQSKQKNRRVELIAEGITYTNIAEMVTQIETNNIEKHSIDQTKKTQLNLSKGTEITIPKNAFCHLDGTPISDAPIEMTFKEAFEYIDMIDERLFTQTKDQILETGGMIYMEASQNGKPLRLQEGKSIDLLFPKQEQKEGMELFTGVQVNDEDGNPGEIIWEETGEEITSVKDESERPRIEVDLSPLLEYKFENFDTTSAYLSQIPPYPKPARISYPPFKGNYTEEGYKIAYEKYEAVMDNYEKDKIDRPERLAAWHKAVEERKALFYTHKKNFIAQRVLGRINFNLRKIREKQHDISHDVLLNTSLNFLEEAVGRAAYDDEFFTKKFFGPALGDVKKYGESPLYVFHHRDTKTKYFCQDFVEILKDVKLSIVEKKYELGYVDKDVVTRYAVRASNLGWINCDRFYELNADEMMDLHFAQSEGDNQYYLVFKNIRSLIRPTKIENGEVIFERMPKGEDVRIVALNIKNNDAFLAAQDFTIGFREDKELAFAPAKISDIKNVLSNI